MTYPMHDKLSAVRDRSQAIGEFLDWADERGWSLHDTTTDDPYGRTYPVRLTINQILAEFFGIDLEVLEDEKRRMLDFQRALNEERIERMEELRDDAEDARFLRDADLGMEPI